MGARAVQRQRRNGLLPKPGPDSELVLVQGAAGHGGPLLAEGDRLGAESGAVPMQAGRRVDVALLRSKVQHLDLRIDLRGSSDTLISDVGSGSVPVHLLPDLI